MTHPADPILTQAGLVDVNNPDRRSSIVVVVLASTKTLDHAEKPRLVVNLFWRCLPEVAQFSFPLDYVPFTFVMHLTEKQHKKSC
jgi:hypothetical protein